jgi:uncharacterized membrane-anchored protein YhcB (DUF1043 family)
LSIAFAATFLVSWGVGQFVHVPLYVTLVLGMLLGSVAVQVATSRARAQARFNRMAADHEAQMKRVRKELDR